MREALKQIFIDIHGGTENVNSAWLDIHNDDEIIGMITAAGRLGVSVSRLSSKYHEEVLRTSLPASRRERETRKGGR